MGQLPDGTVYTWRSSESMNGINATCRQLRLAILSCRYSRALCSLVGGNAELHKSAKAAYYARSINSVKQARVLKLEALLQEQQHNFTKAKSLLRYAVLQTLVGEPMEAWKWIVKSRAERMLQGFVCNTAEQDLFEKRGLIKGLRSYAKPLTVTCNSSECFEF